ncbi:hypothetical protein GYMLUDRAFT_183090 [Collybiopsis luxurians FD-317 M1]|uniref:Unplaced genomic scaffold GYMLUscaffold_169, whole genome shotgun sequence n=1 Tax=Collybiopsis luxurians FD-317 M1 TaxID=944289 RepID=A0A0D0BXM5_9AGAR|nr:hypothetical protein GYMLUDRAFT_183090 [Collybiopsis luxurians FD-317 M1]
MVLKAGKPTLEAMRTKNEMQLDNVFCLATLQPQILSCDTDLSLRPLLTDHYPIITRVNLQVDLSPECPRRNWRKMEWDSFLAKLLLKLKDLGKPIEIQSKDNFNARLKALDNAILEIIDAVVL